MTSLLEKFTQRVSVSAGLTALAIAATGTAALLNLGNARRAERKHPPIGKFLEIDGVRLHYIDRGEGPAVVLLHGNAVVLQDFDGSGLIDALAARHRVIAFDRPGYGYSSRPHGKLWTAAEQANLFTKALLRLKVIHPVLVGHSWGTLPALEMAVRSSNQTRGLVLLGGYYYPSLRLDSALSAALVVPVIGDAMRYTISPITGRLFIKQMVKTMFYPMVTPRRFLDAVPLAMTLRPSQLRAQAQDGALMSSSAAALESYYDELRMPVDIFAGASDKVVSADAHSRRLHSEVRDSALTIVPGVGHMIHYAIVADIVASVEAMIGASNTIKVSAISRP